MICAFAAFFVLAIGLFGVLRLFLRDFPTCKPFLLTFATLVLSSFDFFVTKVVFRAYIYMPFNCSVSEINQLSVSKITGVRPLVLFKKSDF